MAGTSLRKWALVGGGAAACVACCAPLIAPLAASVGLAGLGGAGAAGAAGLPWGEIVCVAGIAAVLAGGLFLLARWNARRRAVACACDADGDEGANCEIGGACDPGAKETLAPR